MMRKPENRIYKSGKINKYRTMILCVCILFISLFSVSAENVVQIPFLDNIPSFVPYYWQAQHILSQGTIFEGLYGYAPDPNGLGGVKVVPVIAEKATPSKDGRVWTVTVRKDKKWSNGDPVTAEDFVWTYKYMCDPKLPDVPLWANHLQYVLNGWAVKSGGIPVDDLGVKLIDTYTIQFTLAQPRFDFNCWLVVAGAMPIHRATVEKFGADWWKPGNIVVNGPYIPISWIPNSEAVLVKNTNYVGECGNIDKIVLKNFPQNTTQIPAFQAGEIDAAFMTNVADYKLSTKDADLKLFFNETPSDLFWNGYQWTRSFNELNNNKKLRQAFAMAIDRKKLCDTVLNGRAVATASYWADNNFIGKKMKGIPFDVKAAQKLLAEAGFKDGKGLPKMKFYITGSMPEVEFIVDQWKTNLKVNIEIESLEAGVYWNQFVWANYTPDAAPGFVRINSPMNSFEAGSLDKNASHNLWVYDFDVKARKKWYELEEEKTALVAKESGTKDDDWKPLVVKRDELIKATKAITGKEKHKIWLEELTRKPMFDEQFNDVYANYKKAATDKEKIEFWRNARRVLIEQEKVVVEYNGMNESNKQARRMRFDLLNVPFEKALTLAPAYLQVMQDQCYMVPLYTEKAQYLLRKKIDGFMLYKFSWGPNVAFNFKYMNIK